VSLRFAPALLAATALAVAGCGGSSKTKTTTAPPASAHTAQATTATPASGGTASVNTGPVRGSLVGPNHSPTAGKLWPYTVKVSDPAGKPLSGTVDIEFLLSGQIVGRDKPPTHPLNHGTWHDLLTFPANSVGIPLTFQAVVHTPQGSITLDWPVNVKR
jgi:hypothetical protein